MVTFNDPYANVPFTSESTSDLTPTQDVSKTLWNFPANDTDIQHMIRIGMIDFRDRTTFNYNAGPADIQANGANIVNRGAIYLPIPDNVSVAYAPTWDFVDLQLYSFGVHKAGKIIDAVKKTISTGDFSGMATALKPFQDESMTKGLEHAALYTASRVARGIEASAGDAIELGFAKAYNPFREAIFRGVSNRSFNFSWNLFPRNLQDCQDLQQILQVLKYNSMPDITSDSLLFEYPGEFTINWYSAQNNAFVENLNLPKIGYCVCNSIETNFTTNGIWAALQNGHPVDISLALTMTEVEIVTKQKIQMGY